MEVPDSTFLIIVGIFGIGIVALLLARPVDDALDLDEHANRSKNQPSQ